MQNWKNTVADPKRDRRRYDGYITKCLVAAIQTGQDLYQPVCLQRLIPEYTASAYLGVTTVDNRHTLPQTFSWSLALGYFESRRGALLVRSSSTLLMFFLA